MKKWLVLFFCIVSLNVQAETICKGITAQQITLLKQDFDNCLLDFPEGTDSNIVMINITSEKIDCMQNVAHKVFDLFYESTKSEKYKQFENFVKVAKEQGRNIEMGSDIGKHWHTTTLYELGSLNYAYVLVHNLVKDYIHYMELECSEIVIED